MYCTRKLTDDMFYVGGTDRRLALFENIYPLPLGVSYNSYLILDEKTVLLDTADEAIATLFLENVKTTLAGRNLDYLIVNHMEPDHAACIAEIIARYPEVTIVGNQKVMDMIKQFFNIDVTDRAMIVKENDELVTGVHTFKFFMAPMVHWPEVMVTYDQKDKILYSADAFGTFDPIDGDLYAQDKITCENLVELRRYYANIVGKYGPQVQMLLKKAAKLEIEMICPLHGPVYKKNIDVLLEKYQKWSKYEPENPSVMIVYGSVYNNTAKACEIIANELALAGVKDVRIYDSSKVDVSYLMAEAFRCSHIVLGAATYNAGIFTPMENFLHDLKAHNLQNRTVAIVENGSWALCAGDKMTEIVASMKNMSIIEPRLTIKSALKDEQMDTIQEIVAKIKETM